MVRHLTRRLARLEGQARLAVGPDKPLHEWNDAELWAVLEHYDPTARERIANMSDADLLAELHAARFEAPR